MNTATDSSVLISPDQLMALQSAGPVVIADLTGLVAVSMESLAATRNRVVTGGGRYRVCCTTQHLWAAACRVSGNFGGVPCFTSRWISIQCTLAAD